MPLIRTAEGEHLTDDRAKADHLSEFFRSVFSSETGFNPSALQSFEDTPIMETVQFSEGMVLTELLRLKESKSPGPDEIPAKILKELAGELSKPLSMLFHTSFETGYLPPDWKSAWITPLYKGGSRVSANNYRPVSLTSICCKIMEKIIKQQLMQFLEQNHLLSDSQHGFRKGRSCVTNLLYCLEHWTRAVDRGDMVHAIYIDFKKAFVSVPHHRLLYKLSRAGVRGRLLMWIRSFIIGHSQAVHVGDQQSAEVVVKSGVPQGSVLGPMLFLVYVNDCANELNCDVAMFADDIKIWSTIRSEVDEARLQTSLDHLEQWSKDWLLPFNINKCTFLRVGRTSSPNHTVYRLTGKPLQEVDAQKDLGVWITTSPQPSLQCSKVAKSAMSMLYLVKRAFSSFDEDCFAKSYDWGKIGSASMVCQLKAASSPSFACEPSKPYAELWMGTHPSGPSKFADQSSENLADYINKDTSVLGTESVKLFGKTLPFLFKVLSVNKALSIQAHPNKTLAEKLHADHPDVYKDDNHKPELAIALSDFEALLCFRPLEEILVFCRGIPELQGLLKVDLSSTDGEGEKALIKRLYSLLMNSPAAEVHAAVTTLAARLESEGTLVLSQPAPSGLDLQDLSALFLRLNQQFPGDVGCFSIFFFNYVKLRPGEAIFLGISPADCGVTLPAVRSASIILFVEGSGTISPSEQADSPPPASSTAGGGVQFGRGSIFFVPAGAVMEIRPGTEAGDILAFRAYANVE
nr:unnamed protein product [Spirometra erinaceieuropaei]